jgi:hypothetical protein
MLEFSQYCTIYVDISIIDLIDTSLQRLVYIKEALSQPLHQSDLMRNLQQIRFIIACLLLKIVIVSSRSTYKY